MRMQCIAPGCETGNAVPQAIFVVTTLDGLSEIIIIAESRRRVFLHQIHPTFVMAEKSRRSAYGISE